MTSTCWTSGAKGCPEFDGEVLEAKYARLGGREFSNAQREAFAELERMAMRFALADRVLISTPMWNFGLPYKLKQWFDLIVQPGLTFRFDPAQGYLPLLKDRPTIAIVASGGDFVTGMNRGRIDMATPYLGVTCIWLLPFFPSPLRDDGYDIADYVDVNPSYRTLAILSCFDEP